MIRVGYGDGDDMFIHVVIVWMMQVTIVEIVDMPVVEDGRMAAVGAMLVIVWMVMGCSAG